MESAIPGMSRVAKLKGYNVILLSIVKRPRKRKVE
jgi:hypothetical protein